MKKGVATVGDVRKRGYRVDFQDPKQLDRPINFIGAGWYSLDDDGVYRYGQFATFSRIRIKA